MNVQFTRWLLLLCLSMGLGLSANAQLSGKYSIDPKGSGDYKSPDEAIKDLNSVGVGGPVLFLIEDGTYSGQLSFTSSISGLSSTNTVTFQSASGDSTKVNITNSGTYTVYFSNCDFIQFERVTISNTGYSYNVYMENGSDYNRFHGCRLIAEPTASYNTLNFGSYNAFSHCRITGSYYPMYIYGQGTGSSSAFGNSIEHCRIVNYGYYGIFEYYQANTKINYNYIDSASSKNMGIYAWYNQNQEIIGNEIYGQAYGAYFYYENTYGSSTDTTIIANNIMRDEQYLGILAVYTPRTKFLHNVFEGGKGNTAAEIDYPTDVQVMNNIFIANGAYYGLYVYYDSGAPAKWDYNDYYFTSCNYTAYFQNNLYSSLSALKSGFKAFHQNSVEVDPEFGDKREGRTYVTGLNNIGKYAGIDKDIDGNPRPNSLDGKVDIGCNDFYLADYDLDVEALVSPQTLKIGDNTVSIMFKNKGSQDLNKISLEYAYSVDGGKNWITESASISSLKTGGTITHTFKTAWKVTAAGNYTIIGKISQQVKGDPDAKDEKSWDICTGISGTYSIGRPSGKRNYATFQAAIKALQCGLAGPVTFNVYPGTYNEDLRLGQILGTSSKNTVTFHSAHVDSCTISHSASSTSDISTIVLNGTDWTTFENFKIEATGSTYGWAVAFSNSANHNQLINNKITTGSTGSSYFLGIVFTSDLSNYYGYGDNGNYNIIEGNDIQGGYWGLYISGTDYLNPCNGNHVNNNKFTKQFYYGVYTYYQDSFEFIGNSIKDFVNTYNYAIQIYYVSNYKIDNNYATTYYNNSLQYANTYNWNSVENSSFSNNMFVITGGNYCFNIYQMTYTNIFHNSINCVNAQNYGFVLQYATNCDMTNNIFAYDGTQYLMYLYSCSFSRFDYNDYYYPKGGNIAYVTGSAVSNLAGLRASFTGSNLHSWVLDPNYLSTNDLHVGKRFPNMFGAKIGLTKDYDYDDRCIFAPSVGADEFEQNVLPPTANFLVPDTAWLNSPTTFLNAAKAGSTVQAKWYVDGKMVSDSFHLVYKFTTTGTATVSLAMENCGGKDSIAKTVFVSGALRKPNVDFIASKTTAYTGDPILLKDLSENGPTSWKWKISPVMIFDPFLGILSRRFNMDSTKSQPVVVFDYPGEYEVCLVVSNSRGADSVCKSTYITILKDFLMCSIPEVTDAENGTLYDDGGPLGNYSYGKNGFNVCYNRVSTCSGQLELTMSEFDLNTGDYLRVYDGTNNAGRPMWDLSSNPKGMTGTLSDPSVFGTVTAKSGSFYVEFESDNNTSTTGPGFALDWKLLPGSFSTPVADFDMPDTACVGYVVDFENKSAGLFNSVEWDVYNDGNIDGYNTNQSHTFGATGSFEVKLKVGGDCAGKDSVTKTIIIENAKKAPNPDIHVSSKLVNAGDTVVLSDLSEYCSDGTLWEISPTDYVLAAGTELSDKVIRVIFTKGGYYDVTLTKENSYGKNTKTWPKEIRVLDYCTPNVLFSNDDISINRVIFNTIDNASASSGKYVDYYNSVSTTVERGLTYYLQVDRTTNKTKMSRKVWIDYNGDGDFDDAGELVAAESPNTTLSFNDSITIPITSESGSTRMRVAVSYKNNDNLACGPHQFGEFEDYKIVISNVDLTPPVLTLKGATADTIEVFGTWVEPGYSAYDKVSGNLTSKVNVSSNLDNTILGSYTVTYSVVDDAGIPISKSRTIEVVDRTLPTLSLLGDENVYVEINTPYTEAGYKADDNYDKSLLVSVSSNVDTTNLGTYYINYCVKDGSENGPVCLTRKVVVGDSTAPVITLVGSDKVTVQVFGNYIDSMYTASDNDMAGLMVTSSGTWTGNPSKLGSYTLVYTATDRAGNTASVTREIEVVDTYAPMIELLGDLEIEVERWATFDDPLYVLSDNYYSSSEITVTTGGTFVNTQSEGVYYVSYQAEDGSGNKSAVLTRLVRVVKSTTGVDDNQSIGIQVYPNPSNGAFNLNVNLASTEFMKVSVLNALGQELFTVANGLTQNLTTRVDLSAYAGGIYYIQVSTGKETRVERISLSK